MPCFVAAKPSATTQEDTQHHDPDMYEQIQVIVVCEVRGRG